MSITISSQPRCTWPLALTLCSKAQYEKLYEDCGIRKNRSDQDWKILDGKLKSRKRKGLESDVFLDGQLMDRKKLRKEISRHPMSINEVLHQARGTKQLKIAVKPCTFNY